MSEITEEENPGSRPVKRQHLDSNESSLSNTTSSDYSCPVCYEVIHEAYITKCGHSFCYSCVTRALEAKSACPKCGNMLSGGIRDVFPNLALDKLVSKYKLLNPGRKLETSGKLGIVSGLRGFVTAESKKLSLSDVDAMLELLTRRKRKLEAESALAQNRLLYEFLERLLCDKESQMRRIGRQVELVKKDVAFVKKMLKEWEAKKPAATDSDHSCPIDKCDNTTSILSSSTNCIPGNIQRRRMCTHFDDFVDCYFSLRAKELVFGHKHAPEEDGNVREKDHEKGLDEFRENLVKFSRFNALRPVATLNYGTDIFNNSTIVSSIEFDKDDEYFAIAGVTKRIKVFEYDSVLRDSVDIHYPCVEMISGSKISCVSWNSYRKNTVASSDYEGAVCVWDAGTGQRTRIFREHEKRCWSVDFNKADAGLMASGSDDARVKLWTLNQERSVACLEAKANVCCVKFNPVGASYLAFGSADHCVHYYDLRHAKRALAIFKGHKKAVSYVKFLNGKEMVSASTDSQLKLWNVDEAHEGCVRSFVGHVNEKNFVGLATDGDYIACGSENNSLYIYYKGLQRKLFTFKFEPSTAILSAAEEEKDRRRDDDVNEFVSAVCWRQTSNILMAANSQGIIKVLELKGKGFLKKGKARLFYNASPKYGTIALVGIGKEELDNKDYKDGIDPKKENVRRAVANGCSNLSDCGIQDIIVSAMGDSESAAEGSTLATWKFQEYKKKQEPIPKISLFEETESDAWCSGIIKSNAQNWSRKLTESAANHMTPTIFSREVQEVLEKKGVNVLIRDKSWAEKQKMGGLLNVAKGSMESLAFLEITYSGGNKNDKPVVLVGKGVTFDSGGISIKPSASMGEMRADMMGAANVVAAISAVADLKLPINIVGLTPLCENMPSSSALKPGDVIVAMNGKSIQVDNTDAEGRLILADALCYAATFNPQITLDLATLTGAMVVALGEVASGVFSTSDTLWDDLEKAGHYTGDRMWRFPLWNCYSSLLQGYSGFDLDNIGKGTGGGACKAAAFLKEFAPPGDWAHMDIAGVMKPGGESGSYISSGMSGKPTRALVQLISNLSKKT